MATSATIEYIASAREFLTRAHNYLAEGDLHQASEKGWGAAAHIAKAVAAARGWEYERHDDFHRHSEQVSIPTQGATLVDMGQFCEHAPHPFLPA